MHAMMPQGRRGSARGSSLVTGQAGDAGERGEWGDNENKLSRVLFNVKSCLHEAASAARTRILMASEQDEEEEQVSGECWRTRY